MKKSARVFRLLVDSVITAGCSGTVTECILRIIAGTDRGRTLKAPPGLETRPTLDKVRGAIFNVLFNVAGLAVLDMFGGSGAMGFEALSRGAEKCVIIEKNPGAYRVMEENRNNLSCGDRAELRLSDFRRAVHRGECFDIIFLDPPYREHLLEDALSLIAGLGLKKEDGIIVAETGVDVDPDLSPGGFQVIKEKNYGKTKVIFLK